jgi:hypothetical protein
MQETTSTGSVRFTHLSSPTIPNFSDYPAGSTPLRNTILRRSLIFTEVKNMERFNQLQDLVKSMEGDFEKFYVKHNKAAGVRVRKHMQELRSLAQEIRAEISTLKNTKNETA